MNKASATSKQLFINGVKRTASSAVQDQANPVEDQAYPCDETGDPRCQRLLLAKALAVGDGGGGHLALAAITLVQASQRRAVKRDPESWAAGYVELAGVRFIGSLLDDDVAGEPAARL